MGRRGPKPTPTPILAARGSWLAKTRTDEPEAIGLPVMPDWLAELDPFAVEVWHWLVPRLVAQQTAATIDSLALAMACHHYSVWRRASELAECAEPGTLERNRLRAEANAAALHWEKAARCFGLTAADRAGMHVEVGKPHAADEKTRFFESAN